jgi:hypothetical protein
MAKKRSGWQSLYPGKDKVNGRVQGFLTPRHKRKFERVRRALARSHHLPIEKVSDSDTICDLVERIDQARIDW